MSIKSLAWAFEQTVNDSTAKLVLIALCNSHNSETGKCFPSHSDVAAIADCSVRTVTRKVKWLAEQGWIQIIPTYNESGRTSNSYYISVDANLSFTDSVKDTGVVGVKDTGVRGIRKVTVSSSNRNKKTKAKKGIEALALVVGESHAQAVVDHRKSIRKPLTDRAAELLAKEFAKTPDPQAAADQMIMNGWQGFNAQWGNKQNNQGNSGGMDFLRELARGEG
jgi:DNA-binding transcriptional MocR family regulator